MLLGSPIKVQEFVICRGDCMGGSFQGLHVLVPTLACFFGGIAHRIEWIKKFKFWNIFIKYK